MWRPPAQLVNIQNVAYTEVTKRGVYLATRFRVDFKRRFELSSLTGGQYRSRSLRAFRLVAVALVNAAVVVRCVYPSTATHH